MGEVSSTGRAIVREWSRHPNLGRWQTKPVHITREAVKLTENIFRAANIALVNELKMVYSAMRSDRRGKN